MQDDSDAYYPRMSLEESCLRQQSLRDALVRTFDAMLALRTDEYTMGIHSGGKQYFVHITSSPATDAKLVYAIYNCKHPPFGTVQAVQFKPDNEKEVWAWCKDYFERFSRAVGGLYLGGTAVTPYVRFNYSDWLVKFDNRFFVVPASSFDNFYTLRGADK